MSEMAERDYAIERPCKYCGGTDGVNGCYECWGRTGHPPVRSSSKATTSTNGADVD